MKPNQDAILGLKKKKKACLKAKSIELLVTIIFKWVSYGY